MRSSTVTPFFSKQQLVTFRACLFWSVKYFAQPGKFDPVDFLNPESLNFPTICNMSVYYFFRVDPNFEIFLLDCFVFIDVLWLKNIFDKIVIAIYIAPKTSYNMEYFLCK